MNDKIGSIASVHLGKAGDGSIVKPYVTPDTVDSSLLVGIPRVLNRTAYGIEPDDFDGRDIWNCYETSFLLDNGYPVSGVLVIDYPSDSPNIVESKSLKLYLNSFNMMRLGTNKFDARDRFERMVEDNLTTAIYGEASDFYPITAQLVFNQQVTTIVPPFTVQFSTVEDLVDVSAIQFDKFTEDASTLELVINSYNSVQRLHTAALRSNCRVTNQPDWGDVFIHVKGNTLLNPESFLQYIVSLRQENHFHEEICEMIYKRLKTLLDPEELLVSCLYTRRGGIDINPVRASSIELLHELTNFAMAGGVFAKTMRQ
jgi:7-cyano-7-deazaguanine reductase